MIPKITLRAYLKSVKNILIGLCLITLLSLPVLAQNPTNYTSFKPGAVWLADDGIPIDCHGGNILYVDSLKTFYWYGEHRAQPAGASCYSSKDLYNWKNEGVVMEKGTRPINSSCGSIMMATVILLQNSVLPSATSQQVHSCLETTSGQVDMNREILECI
jgi:hypothetical protein